MYKGANTIEDSVDSVRVRAHQSSCLYLFSLIINLITIDTQGESQWYMLFLDNIPSINRR